MAFPLFPKSAKSKRADLAKREPGMRLASPPAGALRAAQPRTPVSAREVAASALAKPVAAVVERASVEDPPAVHEATMTGPPSIMDWTPANQMQVAEANPGLCAVVENAALLFANGQTPQARRVLEEGIANDADTRLSPLSWLALFDALRREGDRPAFDQLSLRYVVEFERSPPSWEELGQIDRASARPAVAGFAALTGKLTEANAVQIANLLAATQKQAQMRLDVGALTGADDVGARLLADAMSQMRRRRYPLLLLHTEKLRRALENAIKQGRSAGEGYWTLLLELLQWEHDSVRFEDCALEFAVTFEVSPPSWEPPPRILDPGAPVALAAAASPVAGAEEALVWQGELLGSNDKQLARLAEFRENRSVVTIDMSAVDRIDFVCAGALFNAIARTENMRKAVQIVGASPLLRALLLLLGISPRHFVKKAA